MILIEKIVSTNIEYKKKKEIHFTSITYFHIIDRPDEIKILLVKRT